MKPIKCGCGKPVELTPLDPGYDYKDLMLRTSCGECSTRMRKLLGHESSPGAPTLSNQEEWLKRVKSMRVKMPHGEGSQQAPSVSAPRALFS